MVKLSRRYKHNGIVHQGACGDLTPVGAVQWWSGFGHGMIAKGPYLVTVVEEETPVTCLECLAYPLFTG